MNKSYLETMAVRVDPRSYLRVMQRRRLTILAVFSAVLLLTAAYLGLATPMYRTSATIIIEKESPNLLSLHEALAADASETEYYQTQFRLIESRAVAEKVLSELNLDLASLNPDGGALEKLGIAVYADQAQKAVRNILGMAEKSPPSEDERTSMLMEEFQKRVDVAPVRNSHMVSVSFEAADRRLAADVTNAVARSYISLGLQTRLKASQDVVEWLTKSVEEQRRKVETAEKKFQLFKEEHGIITDFASDSEQLMPKRISELSTRIIQAQAQRMELQARYEQMTNGGRGGASLEAIPEVLTNSHIMAIKEREVELNRKLTDLSSRYASSSLQTEALKTELKTLKEKRASEVATIIASLKNEYEASLAKEQSLLDGLGRLKDEAQTLSKQATEYGALKRDAESAKHMYDLLFKRLQEASVAEDLKATNARIVDLAEPPLRPYRPAKGIVILSALIAGLGLSLGAAFLRERLDGTLKTAEDIEQGLGIPFLGSIPLFKPAKEGRLGDLVTHYAPKAVASEAFRGLRTSILFSSAEPPAVILITGSSPQEGKSLSAVNLATAMAQTGSKVLLLDCDLRKPKLHRMFGLERKSGLSNILTGMAKPDEVIRATPVENLDIITTGAASPNPAELLSSNRMAELIRHLGKRYDRVIIDSPPVTAVTDATVLAKLSDGVVLVLRAGVSTRDFAMSSLRQLGKVNAKILGAALNGIDPKRDGYYLQHYYYYGEEKSASRKRIGEKEGSSFA